MSRIDKEDAFIADLTGFRCTNKPYAQYSIKSVHDRIAREEMEEMSRVFSDRVLDRQRINQLRLDYI